MQPKLNITPSINCIRLSVNVYRGRSLLSMLNMKVTNKHVFIVCVGVCACIAYICIRHRKTKSCPCNTDFPLRSDFSKYQAETSFFRFMDRTCYQCKNSIFMGNENYGGWYRCNDPGFELHPPCLAYSFGIGKDWSLDDEIAKNVGCQVFSFDPSINLTYHQRSENNTFLPVGLGGYVKSKDKLMRSYGKNWELKTLGEWIKHLKHEKVIIDYVKFDIEGDEWPALDAMLADGSLQNVKQLAFEAHSTDGAAGFYKHALTLIALENVHGFRKSHSWRHWCPDFAHISAVSGVAMSSCNDMVYLNSRFMKEGDKCKK